MFVHLKALDILPRSGRRRATVVGHLQILGQIAHLGGDFTAEDPQTGRPFNACQELPVPQPTVAQREVNNSKRPLCPWRSRVGDNAGGWTAIIGGAARVVTNAATPGRADALLDDHGVARRAKPGPSRSPFPKNTEGL